MNLLAHLVLFEVSPDPPPLVIGQGVSVLLEQGVDTGNPPVPGVLQILQSETSVLSIGLTSLETVLRPHTLTVNELTLPWLDVSIRREGRGISYNRAVMFTMNMYRKPTV